MVDNEISGSEINTAIQAGTIGNVFISGSPNESAHPSLHRTYLLCLRAAEQVRDLAGPIALNRASRKVRGECAAIVDQIHSVVDASQDAFGEVRLAAPRAVIDAADKVQSMMVRVLGSVSDGARHGKKQSLDIFLGHARLKDAINEYLSAIRNAQDEHGTS
jgi:hypothetical protein